MLQEYKIGKSIIRFDEEKHRFWDEKGNSLPSVTTITSIIDKSDILMNWAIKKVKVYLSEKIDKGEQITTLDIEEASKEPRKIKETAGNIGTEIHNWIAEWIKAEAKPEIPDGDEIRNGIIAFLQFQRKNKIRWIESERVVYSKKYKFCGILDAVGKMNNKLVLVDFKSSNGLYPDFAFQTAGYQIAYEEETGKKINYRLVIRFGKENGEFEYKKYEDNEKDKEVFLACLKIVNRLNEMKKG